MEIKSPCGWNDYCQNCYGNTVCEFMKGSASLEEALTQTMGINISEIKEMFNKG